MYADNASATICYCNLSYPRNKALAISVNLGGVAVIGKFAINEIQPAAWKITLSAKVNKHLF